MFARVFEFLKSIYWDAIDVNDNNIGTILSQREKVFDKSKRLSDFVQIIISISFCVFVISKLSEYFNSSEDIYNLSLFYISKISASIFLAYFAFYTSTMLYYYFLSEVIIVKYALVRFVLLLFYIFAYIGTIHGLVKFINELSRTFSN